MQLTEQDLKWAKDNISKIELFKTCTQDEMAKLLDGLEKERYKLGATILFQGEISCKLCLVESGTVSVWARKGKDRAKVAELGPNSFFGEISLLTPSAANATIKAETDAEIVFLPGEVLQAIVKENPSLADDIKKKIAERLEMRKQVLEKKD
ncbi:MAG TPA: hypothetical protein DEE98_08530 [Elusimicrobia bacterium]|nr:MAG: hypothetical protein A2278_05120 [Elusimicrobia bacterium RIFOXYA12_FULL_49_49]OGS15212.1 MAG: hypothetical protein A2251_06850 [Elusimicrobia bacterium RIFOXYA2_FULL_47_53]OGS25933.1 MAG: hypothetical protein A2339_00955 [Elusimicrobia bacterium RIFOXYB12_FULL_50_12]OGS30263.1 MAG: hypothetical protein A2323_05425 [Elusimicrobia bacterium RIFOXYB2_FULL_46_23]HBU70407.1 hypothetical protein [Elusimicrobiota bacterium]